MKPLGLYTPCRMHRCSVSLIKEGAPRKPVDNSSRAIASAVAATAAATAGADVARRDLDRVLELEKKMNGSGQQPGASMFGGVTVTLEGRMDFIHTAPMKQYTPDVESQLTSTPGGVHTDLSTQRITSYAPSFGKYDWYDCIGG